MNIYAKRGDKVAFTKPRAGYDADISRAAERLEIGKIYTVERVIIGGFSSKVVLKEVSGVKFNTVQFTDLDT
jgi:hypothetical protein